MLHYYSFSVITGNPYTIQKVYSYYYYVFDELNIFSGHPMNKIF